MASPSHIWAGLSSVTELAKKTDIPDVSVFATKTDLQNMKDKINEKIPVTDSDGNPIYESSASFTDTSQYGSFLYGSLLNSDTVDIHTYSANFPRAVSSVKMMVSAEGSSWSNPNYASMSFHVATSTGLTTSSAGLRNSAPTNTLNANINFGQFLSSITFTVKARASSSNSLESGGGYFSVTTVRIYLPEQLLS